MRKRDVTSQMSLNLVSHNQWGRLLGTGFLSNPSLNAQKWDWIGRSVVKGWGNEARGGNYLIAAFGLVIAMSTASANR